jgi:hypothetical protein
MNNVLMLVRKNDSGGPRHGGWRTYRHFDLYLNGVLIEAFSDDSPNTNYDSDSRLDNRINYRLELLERALGCKALRARIRDFNPYAGAPVHDPLAPKRRQVGVNAAYRA